MNNGYVKLPRSLIDDPLWHQLPEAWLKLWLGILMSVNIRPSNFYDAEAKKNIPIPAGAKVTSVEKLAEFCHISPKQARAGLAYLERAAFVARSRASRYSIVSVCGYEPYAPQKPDEGKVEGKVQGHERADMRATEGDVKNKTYARYTRQNPRQPVIEEAPEQWIDPYSNEVGGVSQ